MAASLTSTSTSLFECPGVLQTQANGPAMYRFNVASSNLFDLRFGRKSDSLGQQHGLWYPLVAWTAKTYKYGTQPEICHLESKVVFFAVIPSGDGSNVVTPGADADPETEADQQTRKSAPKHALDGAKFFFSQVVIGYKRQRPFARFEIDRYLGYATDATVDVKLLVESMGKQGWVTITPLLLDLSAVETKIRRLVSEGVNVLANLELCDVAPFFRFRRGEAAAKLSALCGKHISMDDVRLLCKAVGVGRWPSQTVRGAVSTVYKGAGLTRDLDLIMGPPGPPRPRRSLAAPQQQQQFLIAGLMAQQQQGFPLHTQALGRRPGLPPPAPKRGKRGNSRPQPQQQQQLLAAPLQPPFLTPGPVAQSQLGFGHGVQPGGFLGGPMQRFEQQGPALAANLGRVQLQQLGMGPDMQLQLQPQLAGEPRFSTHAANLGGPAQQLPASANLGRLQQLGLGPELQLQPQPARELCFSVQAPNPQLGGLVQQFPGGPGLLAGQAPAAWHMEQAGAAAPGPLLGVPGPVRRRVRTNRFCAGGGQGAQQQLQALVAVSNLQPQGLAAAAGAGAGEMMQLGGTDNLELAPAAAAGALGQLPAAPAGALGQLPAAGAGAFGQLPAAPAGALGQLPAAPAGAGGWGQLQGDMGLILPLQVEGGISMDPPPPAAPAEACGQLPAAAGCSGQLQDNDGLFVTPQIEGGISMDPLPAAAPAAGGLGQLPAAMAVAAGGVQLQGDQGLNMQLEGAGVAGAAAGGGLGQLATTAGARGSQLQGGQGLMMKYLRKEKAGVARAAARRGLGQLPAATGAGGGQLRVEGAGAAAGGGLGQLATAVGVGGPQLQGDQGFNMHLQQDTGVLGGAQWLAGQELQDQQQQCQQQQQVGLLANLPQPPPAFLEELPYIGGYSQQHHKQQQQQRADAGLSNQHPMPTGVDVRATVQRRRKQQRSRENSTHQPELAGVAEGLQHASASAGLAGELLCSVPGASQDRESVEVPVGVGDLGGMAEGLQYAGAAGELLGNLQGAQHDMQGLEVPLGVAQLPLAIEFELQPPVSVGGGTLQQQQQLSGLELEQFKQQQQEEGEEQQHPLLEQQAQDEQADLLQLHREFSYEHALPHVDLPLPPVDLAVLPLDLPVEIGLEAAQEVSAHTHVLPELPAVGGDDLEVLGMESGAAAGAADEAGLMDWLDGVLCGDVPASPYG